MRAALLLLAACGPAPLELSDMPCPPEGTRLTYASFGQTFFADHCNACHASAANGAPAAYKFDTLDEVRMHRARIFVRAAGPNDSMPPGPDDPPADERDALAEWLACGAP
jgi:mono/diheme cytochrome c family protein